ncbi:serine hydrolase domain-containing protein [Aquimarina spongiae]|uniref:CubicO group peptidase, beta-lactamase class C family n=1 Tax=Aquimarina spongiae TaxID=570521 RepID=A0A1M6JU90_9FLAO|nr:serine hydrolase domain-containing protein [Aquimarina spongiae]SHJ50263.1 CubicO group peptidase, beta-lactamase class C family [Aquimarina spongiae]
MKKILISVFVLIILIFSYFLFEPIFVYTTGWKPLSKIKAIPPVVHHTDTQSKKADSVLKAIHQRLQSPAVSIAVGQHGKIQWANAIGYQNLDDQIPVALDTKFRIGSTSKAVTSLGIGVLLQNQKLQLDSEVKDFVSYASGQLSNINLRQLASHTSGIRNYGSCLCFPIWEYYNNDEYTGVEESVGIFNNDDLLFEPGSDFSYSSYNYTLLSGMLEGASHQKFPDFMKQNVFKPINISNIEAETATPIKNTARFYDIAKGTYKEVYKVNNSNKWAGGGFLATPTALVKIGNAFLNHQLFGQDIQHQLTQPVLLDNGKVNPQEYAIGWRNHRKDLFRNGQKITVWHHGGIANGSISLLALFPEYNLSVSMLANKNGNSGELFENVYAIAKLFIQQTSK